MVPNNPIHDAAKAYVEAMIDKLRQSMVTNLQAILGEEVDFSLPSASPKTPARRAPKGSKKTAGGRLARRTPEEIAEVVGRVAALLRKHPDGLRSEQIQSELDLDRREVPRVLREGVSSRALSKKGEKRATVYFAGKGGKVPRAKAPRKVKASRKAPKKASRKAPKRSASKRSAKRAPTKKAPKAKASAAPVTTDKAAE